MIFAFPTRNVKAYESGFVIAPKPLEALCRKAL